jgi:hypothetical protein
LRPLRFHKSNTSACNTSAPWREHEILVIKILLLMSALGHTQTDR